MERMKAPDPLQQGDDIAALNRHLGAHQLRYQDIALLTELRQARQRWPLLAETETRASNAPPGRAQSGEAPAVVDAQSI